MAQLSFSKDDTKIAIFDAGKFQELGYSARMHPEGYVYFTKDTIASERGGSESNHKDATEKNAACATIGDNSGADGAGCVDSIDGGQHAHLYQDVNIIASEDSGVNQETGMSNQLANPRTLTNVHSASLKSMKGQIESEGFARCMLNKCNFMSDSVSEMKIHCSRCSGVTMYSHMCKKCMCSLSSADVLKKHRTVCRGEGHVAGAGQQPNQKKLWEKESAEHSYLKCKNRECNFISLSQADMLLHLQKCTGSYIADSWSCSRCKTHLMSTKERLTHELVCKPNSSTTSCTHSLKQSPTGYQQIQENPPTLQDGQEALDSDHIIQPGPRMNPGEYYRRRGFSRQLKEAWTATIQQQNYVKCIYQNCHFLAMSLEDMIFHYGYCRGDSSFAKFTCPYCQGRVTSQTILELHVRRSHSSEQLHDGDVPADGSPTVRTIEGTKNMVRIRCIRTMLPQREDDSEEAVESTSAGLAWVAEDKTKESRTKQLDNTIAKVIRTYRGKRLKNEAVHEETPCVAAGCLTGGVVEGTTLQQSANYTAGRVVEEKTLQQSANYTAGRVVEEKTLQQSANNVGEGAVEETTLQKPANYLSERAVEETTLQQPADMPSVEKLSEDCEQSKSGPDSVDNKGRLENSERTEKLAGAPDPTCVEDSNECEGVGLTCASSQDGAAAEPRASDVLQETSAATVQPALPTPSTKRKRKNDSPYRVERLSRLLLNAAAHASKTLQKQPRRTHNRKRQPTPQTPVQVDPPPDTSAEERPPEGEIRPESEIRTPAREARLEEVMIHDVIVKTERTESVYTDGGEVKPPRNTSNKRKKRLVEEFDDEDDVPLNLVQVKTPAEEELGNCNTREQPSRTPRKKKPKQMFQCAKCAFTGTEFEFNDHNIRKHIMLSWVVGAEPLDMTNPDVYSPLVKRAFRYVKSATCELCQDIKKSALGFIAHIERCGKSAEERQALKVQCPHCSARVLKYSLPIHLKLSHGGPPKPFCTPVEGKRAAAVIAVSKLQAALQGDCYKKGSHELPKLPKPILWVWHKMVREKKKIPCRRGGCLVESSGLRDAHWHHFNCPELPEQMYPCENCDFYSTVIEEQRQHLDVHKTDDGEANIDLEEELDGEEDAEEQEQVPTVAVEVVAPPVLLDDPSNEARLKKNFITKEKLLNERGNRTYRQTLRMTLTDELLQDDLRPERDKWLQELHTRVVDWTVLSGEAAAGYLPLCRESVALHTTTAPNKTVKNPTWKKYSQFEGDIAKGTPTFFTGGMVRALSWCPISARRTLQDNARQYLAVSVARTMMDRYQDAHHSESGPGLIQIWDCGPLQYFSSEDPPKLAMCLAHCYGEVWDLSWYPCSAYTQGTDKQEVARLGVLAAGCQDGSVRLWAVCDPNTLQLQQGDVPVVSSPALVTLTVDEGEPAPCLQLSWAPSGLLVAGLASGLVAVWHLKNINSLLCRRHNRSRTLRPHATFQAHKNLITALSVCPFNERLIITGALDRTIKFWDLESPEMLIDTYSKGVCLSTVWPRHWPVTLSSFEDALSQFSVSGSVKNIRDFFGKPYSTLHLTSQCWCLTFSDWLNVACGCNSGGEVRVRLFKNMLVPDEKTRHDMETVLSTVEVRRLDDSTQHAAPEPSKKESKSKSTEVRDFPKSYQEAQQDFGIIITDYAEMPWYKKDCCTDKRPQEEYPLASANKISFNPNIRSFSHMAVGYHCGIVRIQRMRKASGENHVKEFLKWAENYLL